MKSQVTEPVNRRYWDIIKGIGSVNVVLGHCCGGFPLTIRFVYLSSALFFFVSGFLYSEDKYANVPHLNLAARIHSTWLRYVVYMCLLTLITPLFLYADVPVAEEGFSGREMFKTMVSAITFSSDSVLGGSLWFVPALIVASAIYGVIVCIGYKVRCFIAKPWIKDVAIIMLSLLIGAVGVLANVKNINLTWHIQTSLVVIPIYMVAWFMRYHIREWMRYLHWLPAMLAMVILLCGIHYGDWWIDLIRNRIYHPIGYYVISLIGVYFCLSCGKYLLRIPVISDLLAIVGKHSFDIMAMHLLTFKLIDLIYARLINETNPRVYGDLPCAFDELWLVYIVAGLFVPVMIARVTTKSQKLLQEKLFH